MASESLVCVHAEWQPGDGGELRVFPYPRPVEVIAPVEGRLVLFEPRMVHDVLPNYKKRFCFTLWCGVKGAASSQQIDHETLSRMELEPSLASAAAIAEAWRRREQRPLVYDETLPRVMRSLFLPEMRMCLVRMVNPAWALDLLRQLSAVEATNGEGYATAARGVVRPAELCDLALRLGPWWI